MKVVVLQGENIHYPRLADKMLVVDETHDICSGFVKVQDPEIPNVYRYIYFDDCAIVPPQLDNPENWNNLNAIRFPTQSVAEWCEESDGLDNPNDATEFFDL